MGLNASYLSAKMVCMRKCVCVCVCVCVYVCMYVCMYVRKRICMCVCTYLFMYVCMYACTRGADKSLARPGRKQATATNLGIYSTYSPRSSIHFLVRSSNFYKPLEKRSESCPSNQVSAAAMTSASDEKWRPFDCFFSPGNRW